MRERQGWSIVLMAGLYWLWLKRGSWGLGFTIINFGYLVLAWRQSKKKTPLMLFLYGSSVLLGVMTMTRSYGMVRAVTVLTILVVNIIISAWQREKKTESRLIDMVGTVFLTIINTGKVLIEERVAKRDYCNYSGGWFVIPRSDA